MGGDGKEDTKNEKRGGFTLLHQTMVCYSGNDSRSEAIQGEISQLGETYGGRVQ